MDEAVTDDTEPNNKNESRNFRKSGKLRFANVMPLLGAIQALEADGPTPEVRAQAAALAAVRVLMPSPRASIEDAHDAYVDTLRALIAVPAASWPDAARAIRTAVLTLLDEVGELTEEEADRLFAE